MERIGERLRRRREELGLTLEDVSESIRYRPEIIRAVEEGRSGVFPAKAYLSAFLRAYAVILELDPMEIVREQKSEEERAFEAIRSIRVKPKRRRKLPRKVLYILIPIVLAVVLLIVVDRFLWERAPETGPGSGEGPLRAVMRPDTAARDTSAASSQAGAVSEGGNPGNPGGDRPENGTVPPPAPGVDTSGDEAGEDDSARGEPAAERREPDPPGAAASPGGGLKAAGGAVRDDAGEQGTGAGEAVAAATGEAADRAEAGGSQTPGEAQIEPMVPLADGGAGPRRHKLVVSARRGAYISLASGGSSIYDGYFRGGRVDSFYSETSFVVVALTERGAWTLMQDGERVRLPGSSSEDVSNFVIPLPSDD